MAKGKLLPALPFGRCLSDAYALVTPSLIASVLPETSSQCRNAFLMFPDVSEFTFPV